MFSQKMATHELLHRNPVEQYLRSYEFSDSAFSLTEGESQSIEFSQFPNSQELFSNQQLSEKEGKNQSKRQSLANTCESNRELSLNIPKLRVMENEKDERTLLENISNNLKEQKTEFLNLCKAIGMQDLTEVKNEISSMKKDMILQVERISEKVSSEFESKRQLLLSILEESKKQGKEVATHYLQLLKLQESLKEDSYRTNELNDSFINLQKIISSYQALNTKKYIELKQQQNELNRNFLSLQETFSGLSEQMIKRDEIIIDNLKSVMSSFKMLKYREQKNNTANYQEKYSTSPCKIPLFDSDLHGGAEMQLLEPVRKIHGRGNSGENAKNIRLHPGFKKNYLKEKRKAKNEEFKMRKYSLRTTEKINGICPNNSEIFAEEAKPFISCMNHKIGARKNSQNPRSNIKMGVHSLLASDTHLSNIEGNDDWLVNPQDALGNSSKYGCFYKRVSSPRIYESFAFSSNSNIERRGNSTNAFCKQQKCFKNNCSNSRMLSISRNISKVDEVYNSDSSSPSLSITDLAGAIYMNAKKHKTPIA